MNANISLSFELILLVRWLLKHEKEQLNTLVKRALEHGFMQELEEKSSKAYGQVADKLYENIVEFLMFMEGSLVNNLAEFNIDEAAHNAMIPIIKKLDVSTVDLKSLWEGMQQAKKQMSKHYEVHEDPESVNNLLFEQILKHWKPSKKLPLN